MKLTRREFLVKGTALFAAIGLGGNMLYTGQSGELTAAGQQPAGSGAPVLVVIELNGGNDGMNTLIPYGMGGYYDARPTLGILQQDVLALGPQVGLHPSLTHMHQLYQDGRLAIIQGVGYPKPSHSHFRSMEIWQTANPEELGGTGWLGRYAAASLQEDPNPLKMLQIGSKVNKSFMHKGVNVPVIQTIETYKLFPSKKGEPNNIAKAFLDMYDPERQGETVRITCELGSDAYASVEAVRGLAGGYQAGVKYPKSTLARDLQIVSKLLAGGSETKVFYLQLGGFDDHVSEKQQHADLLKLLDEAIQAFNKDLELQGLQERVVTMAFSEFGRRVKENGSGGTDHGTAAPVLVFGGPVKGGLYGVMPSLTQLENGDLKYEVDFRSVYGTVVDGWLRGDARSVLGQAYENLNFI